MIAIYRIHFGEIRLALLAGLSCFVPFNAQAYSCATTFIPNIGCEEGNYVFDSPAHVNDDAPFGFSNWVPLDISNDQEDDHILGIVLFTADTQNPGVGKWVIKSGDTDPWDIGQNVSIMITLEGEYPQNQYVSFLINPGVTEGYYYIGLNQPDLTHATLWGHVMPVPLPAAFWLLLSGMLGIASITTRHRTS